MIRGRNGKLSWRRELHGGNSWNLDALRKVKRFGRLWRDLHCRSILRRVFLRALSAGVNQVLDFDERIGLVMTGAWMMRIAEIVPL
jgi:hypothetical protein